jgi:inward rectifier potassium channel
MKLKRQITDKTDHRNSYAKVINQNGKLEQSELGVWSSYLRDPYHLMLTVSWTGFVLIVSVGYIVINVIFALLFLAGGDCLAGARPGSFPDAFFSVCKLWLRSVMVPSHLRLFLQMVSLPWKPSAVYW